MGHYLTWRNAFSVLSMSVVLGMWGTFSPVQAQFTPDPTAVSYLEDFSATIQENSTGIDLNWSTVTEANRVAGFTIQRVTDVESFSEASDRDSFLRINQNELPGYWIRNRGDIGHGWNYEVTDEDVELTSDTTYYYRLIQAIDNNQFVVLDTISITLERDPTSITFSEPIDLIYKEDFASAVTEDGGAIELTWSTLTEDDISGFFLQRAAEENGFAASNSMSSFINVSDPYESAGVLEGVLINDRGSPTTGGVYIVEDQEADIEPGVTYYYRLIGPEYKVLDTISITIEDGGPTAVTYSNQSVQNRSFNGATIFAPVILLLFVGILSILAAGFLNHKD